MYSQQNEEELILAATPPIGRFLDIGAWDPKIFSNTRALFERGWRGVLVEPSPGPLANLRREYDGVDGMIVMGVAVTLDGNPVEMWITNDAVSTASEKVYEVWKTIGGYERYRRRIPGATVEAILSLGPFDFINIDAEGGSCDLARRILDLGARPACFCIEYDDRLSELSCCLTAAGYLLQCNDTNVVAVRKSWNAQS